MDLHASAQGLVELLASTQTTLVLAESCTGGLVAATLTQIPGVSSWLAGSLVVYQEASKTAWLGVDPETLAELTAVSPPVAHQMAGGALRSTPHADLAAAVTGHLGPDAPADFDGLVYIAVARRQGAVKTWRIELESRKRLQRQREAAWAVMETVAGGLRR
jgi:PncC family amidohydrolase